MARRSSYGGQPYRRLLCLRVPRGRLRLLPRERYAIDNPYTDIDAYDTYDIRNDTEIPNPYPDGTTRSRDSEPPYLGDDGEIERPYDAFEPDDPDGNAENDTTILPDAIGTDAEQGEEDESEHEDEH